MAEKSTVYSILTDYGHDVMRLKGKSSEPELTGRYFKFTHTEKLAFPLDTERIIAIFIQLSTDCIPVCARRNGQEFSFPVGEYVPLFEGDSLRHIANSIHVPLKLEKMLDE